MRLLIAFLLCLPLSAVAEPFTGFSSFAALSPEFPCKQFLQIQSDKPAMVVLLKTFGDSFRCVNRFIRLHKDKRHLLQIHPLNGPCRRNKRCTKDEILPKDSIGRFNRKLEQGRIQVIERIEGVLLEAKAKIKLSPNTHLVISTGLEDNYTHRAFLQVARVVQGVFPEAVIVRSAVGNSCLSYPCESHGVQPDDSARVWNQDGDDLPLSADRTWLGSCYRPQRLLCFLWSARAQGIAFSKFVDPKLRTFEISNSDILNYQSILKGE